MAYADQAGENGAPVVCLTTSERSIVLVYPASARMARLLDRRCVDKLARVDDGIWLATAGLLGDARQVGLGKRQSISLLAPLTPPMRRWCG